MTRQSEDVCALCEHFSFKGYPEHAARGEGRCSAYDNDFKPLNNPFVTWDNRACVRFNESWGDRERRTAWVEKQRAKAKE